MDREWCHECAEGWDYARSLGVALCPLHAAAPALLEALEAAEDVLRRMNEGVVFARPAQPAFALETVRAAIRAAKGETA